MIYSNGTNICLFKFKYKFVLAGTTTERFANTKDEFERNLREELYSGTGYDRENEDELVLPEYTELENILSETENKRFEKIKKYQDVNMNEAIEYIKGIRNNLSSKEYQIDELNKKNENLETTVLDVYEAVLNENEKLQEAVLDLADMIFNN